MIWSPIGREKSRDEAVDAPSAWLSEEVARFPLYVTKLLSFDLLVVLAVSESGYVPLMAGRFRYSYK